MINIRIYFYFKCQTSYKKAHLQMCVTSTANEGRYLEKQNISQMLSTSANILHEFLICCYDPTLRFLIRTAKLLQQNCLHGSNLTHKSNLALICYLLVMSCYRLKLSQIILCCLQFRLLHVDSRSPVRIPLPTTAIANALLKYIL